MRIFPQSKTVYAFYCAIIKLLNEINNHIRLVDSVTHKPPGVKHEHLTHA